MKTTLKKIASLLICLCLIISGMVITASAADTQTYTKIDKKANLSEGTYFMAGIKNSEFHCFTGSATSGHLATSLYSYSNGTLTASSTTAAEVDLVAVSGKTDTFYIKVGTKYVGCSSAAKAKLTVGTTAFEWVANDHSSGGIYFMGTGTYSAVVLGSNKTATSNIIRNYVNTSSISSGVVFFKLDETTPEEPDPEEPGQGGGETPDPTPDPEEPGQGGGETPDPTPDPEEPSGDQEAVTNTYTFSSYTAGSQYVDGTHALDDEVSLSTHLSRCHFTEQLRIYGKTDTQSAGYAVLSSKREITALSINAGHKATTVNVYVSSNGSDWNSTNAVVITASYKDYTVTIPAGTKFVKFEATDAQIRIASMTVSLAAVKAPVAEMGGTSATVGANLGIQQSITLKTEDAANKTLKMDFTIADNTTTVEPVINDGNYTFSFSNIPAHFMTEEITATLYVQEGDDKVEQGTKKYTIAEYGKAIIEGDAYPEVKNFVADMLRYGAAAQKKANHNTDKLATAGLESLIENYGSNASPTKEDEMSLITKTYSDVRFYSANVRFGDTNSLIIKLNDFNENTSVVVRKGDEIIATYSNTKQCVIEGLKATDYATKFIFELKDGDDVIQTLTYGINSYAYAKKADANMQELALALYAYGKSANAIG